MNDAIPKNDAEADALRAYVPAETLAALAEVCREECAEADKRSKAADEVHFKIRAIKERMKQDRVKLKQLEKQSRDHFTRALFPRTDAAREAAWLAAVQARREAIANGEAPRFETVEQCGARQKEGRVYTP